MKYKSFIVVFSLFLCGASPAFAQSDPDDLIITITRLSPVEPALYALYALPVNADAKKRDEIAKKNLALAEKNAGMAKDFVKETEAYLKYAEGKGGDYETEIPVAKAKLKRWKEIEKTEAARAAKLRAQIKLKPHKKALKAGYKRIGAIIKLD